MDRLRRERGPLVAVAGPAEVLDGVDDRVLGVAERARSDSLQDPADRAAYVAAHLLVRRCAAALTGRPVTDLAVHQWCADCGTAGHGRPSIAGLPGVHVSWAHGRGVVVAAAAWHPVGVDVETLPPAGSGAGRFPGLALAEQRQLRAAPDPALLALRHWVRKECLVKAGLATLARVDRVDLSRVVERQDPSGRAVARYRGLHLVDWRDPARRALVAVAGRGAPTVRPPADLPALRPMSAARH
nr:4'-phosphopantetheinyl transferase superfamily protein [Modestobacter marinus]